MFLHPSSNASPTPPSPPQVPWEYRPGEGGGGGQDGESGQEKFTPFSYLHVQFFYMLMNKTKNKLNSSKIKVIGVSTTNIFLQTLSVFIPKARDGATRFVLFGFKFFS